MTIDVKSIVNISEANQNFTKVAKIAEENGQAVIFKHNKPKFVLVDLENGGYLQLSDSEKIDIAAKRVMEKYMIAFKELAK